MSDPNYSDVVLLLHMDGVDGSTAFTDSGPLSIPVTAVGNAQVSTAQGKFGESAMFDGTGDYLQVATTEDLAFGSSDFTIEGWFRITNFSNQRTLFDFRPVDTNGAYIFLAVKTTGALMLYVNTADRIVSSASAVPSGAWTHIACCRSAGTTRLFIDGVLVGTPWTDSTSYLVGGAFGCRIGRTSIVAFSEELLGYADDIRITKGIARYTANFTPPVEAFPAGAIEGVIAASGPLSLPAVLGEFTLVQGFAVSGSMLGLPAIRGGLAYIAIVSAPGPLGAMRLLAYHDFTGQLGDTQTYYVMDLITPIGPVRVPISSWQATLQVSRSNYVQCVIPACMPWIAAIDAATSFVVYRAAVVPGAGVIEYEMARSGVPTARFDRGPQRYTCTLSGYTAGFAPDEDPAPATNRLLKDIRSIGASPGGRRVRCGIDWLLRPTHRVTADGETFFCSYINYYVGQGDAYMDVGERV